MYRYAHIVNNIVINVSVWDEVTPYTPPESHTFIKLEGENEKVGPSWTYEDGIFTPPTPQAE